MNTSTLQAGQIFPDIIIPNLDGGLINLGKLTENYDWKMVIVYRGNHCPICTKLLSEINQVLPELNKLNIDVVAVSANSTEKAKEQIAEVKPNFRIGYDLNIDQMKNLGLFISKPRLGMGASRPFAEPGLFVINENGNVQVIDISNAPFARPNIELMMMGLRYVRNLTEKYPINGTYSN